jgi:predicted transcriptional regulator
MPSRPARKAKEVDVPPNAFLAKSIGGGSSSSSSSSSSRGRKETKATKQQKQKQQLDQQQQDEMQQQQAQVQQELQEQAAAQALYEQVSRVRDDARPRECACLTAWPTLCPLQSVA